MLKGTFFNSSAALRRGEQFPINVGVELITFFVAFAEDAGLCGVHGCPYHAMCLRDPNLGKYACQCPDCYAGDLPTFVCGK